MIEPETVKQDKTGRTLINYSGKPGDYEYISFVDVLDGKLTHGFLRTVLYW